jgi:prophage antirepressor-like protein
MNDLTVFKNKQFGEVRTVEISGEPWFVGKDVATCLAYSNSRKALTDHVDSEDKGVTKCDTLGGKQELTVINESGLYSLILGSKLPTAKQFKRWITAEVIPSIRKTGSYSVKQKSSVPKLGEVNAAARIISKTLKEAGMPPQYRAVAIKSLYAPVGVKIPLDGVTTDKRLFDCTAIAKKFGMLSSSGKPHYQAVAAIIAKLPVSESEKELVPFQNQASGHAGPTWQYAQSVVDKVEKWLEEHDWPTSITAGGKTYKVTYQQAV